eukprot:1032293-Pelagomonas_calceolata.AAC.5
MKRLRQPKRPRALRKDSLASEGLIKGPQTSGLDDDDAYEQVDDVREQEHCKLHAKTDCRPNILNCTVFAEIALLHADWALQGHHRLLRSTRAFPNA